MIYGKVELFNVEEAVEVPGRAGVLLQRVPEAVRTQLKEGAQGVARRAAGVEIRFVNEGREPAVIELAAYQSPSRILVYAGGHQVKEYAVGPEPLGIEIAYPFPGFLPDAQPVSVKPAYSPRVWRLVAEGGEVHLLSAKGEELRPPQAGETPEKKYLAYGTSITQGVQATSPDLSYIRQAGGRLGLDVLNLGLAGAAHCEQAIADHIAGRGDWDIATLCVSINMLNQGVPVSEFRDKAAYLACTAAARNPDKPVICIGLFPSFADLGLVWPERSPQATADEYRRALREIVEQSGLPNLHYIDGRELLTSWDGLSHDLLHPGNSGMIEIGERLAAFMRPLVHSR
ncbi:GDSL-type esterase/lipase family protein [Paenibacillus sp. YN15]|uniref:GDSL-type esterase/lipase family protein n=1 Tax=Paenibacillus sp. YN15 TaxID=1742774 RepID=UPI000DCB1958|nr:GDSL-type esterase/lipase family protein [Paenibacillus sp. YN15]RAV00212.1 hypothetical protein DQG13_14765 [Paenibacillus sp. YN15]